MLWLQSSLPPVQRRSAGVIFAQHTEHVRVGERIAPAADDGKQLVIRAEPFQRRVKFVDDLGLEVGLRHRRGTQLNCVQSGRTSAPRWPHFVHRMRGPNDGTVTSSGNASTSSFASRPHPLHVTLSNRGPRLRMLLSVIGSVGCLLTDGAGGFLTGGLVMPE